MNKKNNIEKQSLNNNNWDNLIVLDACRYDIFDSMGTVGKTEKRRSPGSSTPEWLYRTFTDYIDADYYSSNPYVNSKSKPLNETSNMNYVWYPGDYFKRIYDLWLNSWDDNYNTVFPETMVKFVAKHYSTKNKSIIHFIQPHVPYLHIEPQGEKSKWQSKNNVMNTGSQAKYTKKDEFIQKMITKIPYINEHQIPQWRIRKMLNVQSINPYEILWREYSMRELKKYYSLSLKRTLKSVQKLLRIIKGRTIITADHGELLGEHSYYGHKNEWYVSTLIEVPWVELET
jgi:hypothetical protein